MAVSDITGVNGTISVGEDWAGNVTAFDGSAFWATVSQDYQFMGFLNSHPNAEMDFLYLFYDTDYQEWELHIYLTDNSNFTVAYTGSGYTLAQLGITANLTTDGVDLIVLAVIYGAPPKLYGSVNGRSKQIKTLYGSVNGQSKELTKLYGSVNGASKLIYEKQSGPAYGIVYYKADSSASTVQSVELQSAAEFNSLCQSMFNTSWTATVGGGAVTVSNNSTNVIVGIEIGDQITSIGNYFLYFCTSLDWSFTIPSSVTSIGEAFLFQCDAMTGTINVGSLAATIAQSSYWSFGTAYSSAACYTTGITIAGANRADWLSSFPNSTGVPAYRKLLNAGH